MTKYRRLSNSELEELRDDFVKYLSAQSVTADDWLKLKEKDPEKVDELIDLFSDIVMEKVLSAVEYLELISSEEIRVFHIQETKARLIGLTFNRKGIDLTDPNQFEDIFKKSDRLLSYEPQVYSMEKEHSKSRAEESFFLLNMGATISNKELFEQLNLLYKS